LTSSKGAYVKYMVFRVGEPDDDATNACIFANLKRRFFDPSIIQ
jgi:hypothetical protein